jgi:ABC-2 type transport system permease protein
MKSVKAIFKKQLKDIMKNPAVLIQFIIFPLITFAMDSIMATDFDFEGVPDDIVEMILAGMPNMPNMVTMQAAIFAGMGLMTAISGIISEDMDKKSLRFLAMAGVKPMSYLIGVSGVVFLLSFLTSAAFGLIGGFGGVDFWIFIAAMMSVVAGSTVLGATFGILTGNQQAASALILPIAIILGFGPMMAQFNENIARFLHITYTQQLNIIADYLTIGSTDTLLWHSFGIMWANVAVLSLLFVLVFKKKWSV